MIYFLVIEIKFVFRAHVKLVILSLEMEESVHGLCSLGWP